jgi:hypothetical protein
MIHLRALALLIATVLGMASPAGAANIVVPSGDEAALVTAITTANGNGEDDVIVLANDSTYEFTAANNGSNALPVVTSKITIQGNGATLERQPGPEFRLLDVAGTGDLTLEDVTIRDGLVTFNAPLPHFNDGGGGIRVLGNGRLTCTGCTITNNRCEGDVCQGGGLLVFEQGVQGGAQPIATLVDSVVSENFAGTGGGISLRHNNQTLVLERTTVRDNEGIEGGGLTSNGTDTVTITDSTFSGNTVSELVPGGALGGGILDYGGATYTIRGSTFTGNGASGEGSSPLNTQVAGGAVAEAGGATLTIVNSTFTGNTLENSGPGAVSGAALHGQGGGSWILNNVTIAGNTVTGSGGTGAGIELLSGDMTIRNSIVAGNTAASAPECSFAGNATSSITSQGHNILGDTSGCSFTPVTGDEIGQTALLGPLADNGGPTQTMALLAGSPAIDAGDPGVPGSGGTACQATDQRGTARPQGACDAGAFEIGAASPTTTTTTLPGGACIPRAPTFENIDCRLDLLVADVEGAADLGKTRPGLLRAVTQAREKKIAAETTDPANAKKVKKLLKKSIRKMVSFGFRIRSLSARKNVPAATRDRLRVPAKDIQDDLKALMKSL